MTKILHRLSAVAGIEVSWRDVSGQMHIVSDDTLHAVLNALDIPTGTEAQINESYKNLKEEANRNLCPLITAALDQPIIFTEVPGSFRIRLESGGIMEGVAQHHKNGISLPPISIPGYHQIEVNNTIATIAVAPRRAFTIFDLCNEQKLWGLAVQLYALRRNNGGEFGDFSALTKFIRKAAEYGADAIAISPVHAQFSADTMRYGPYSASNRAALNVLYAPLDMPDIVQLDLIDWPSAADRRLKMLRAKFEDFSDRDSLDIFRQKAGPELERHALFETLSSIFSQNNPAAHNFLSWPNDYQNPASDAVARFSREHKRELEFHIWLQYLVDQGLANAQMAARDSGMKIGIIADMAVGTDPAGSHSWSRRNEMLRGLEIGAPPDLFNRAGQGWGITTFSPRGLRHSGFSAFIDMLRHSLRHAGGLRIDHIMGLSRLWVIPAGLSSAQGAYLKMPLDDLLRIVMLESHRHRAIILGEDLGTVASGFRKKLDLSGISGLQLLWFERQNTQFKSPKKWKKNAVSMTTTHDLPTVSGWWEGTDIRWRKKLGIEGDSASTREDDRMKLWSAFRQSGAAQETLPTAEESSAVVDAACNHLAKTACMLALLPIEDALGLPEQPNLPGTIDEHPNWRRRLPDDSQTLLTKPDVASRLALFDKARKQ